MTALQAAGRLADDLSGIFGARLKAVLVYGTHARPHPRAVKAPVQTLALVESLEYAHLSGAAQRATAWLASGLDMPLLLPVEEFRRSLDAFPLEYGDILAHHILVRGENPFAGIAVAPDDIRRACEVKIRAHAIHLREGFLLTGQRPNEVADLIIASAGPFASLIETYARLTGAPAQSPPDAQATHVARVAGLDRDLIARLLSLEEDHQLDATEAAALFPAYLDLVHALVSVIDAFAAEGGGA